MNTAAMVIGYAFTAVCAVFALAYLWEVALRAVWKRCIDTEDFYRVVVEYARTRRRKRVAGQDE